MVNGFSLNAKRWTLNDFPTPRSSPLTFKLLTINLNQYALYDFYLSEQTKDVITIGKYK